MVRTGPSSGLSRLGALRPKDQDGIVRSMYGNRGHVTLRAAAALPEGTVSSITDRLAVRVNHDRRLDLFGPEFTPVGRAEILYDSVTVTTQHPHAVSALLGELYG
jgi:hypothetical protein